MSVLKIKTQGRLQFVDITDQIQGVFSGRPLGRPSGLVSVFVMHTTASLLIQENERGILADTERLAETLCPERKNFAHDDLKARGTPQGERKNACAHLRASLFPKSITLQFAGRRLILGRWQRIFLVEFDGPRERQVSIHVLSS